MTGPTWYDVLGVERTASTDDIRAAWKSAIEGLDPTDARFRSLSEAASVLLDEHKRAEYDQGLPAEPTVQPAEEAEVAGASPGTDSPVPYQPSNDPRESLRPGDVPDAASASSAGWPPGDVRGGASSASGRPIRWTPGGKILVVLAILTALCVAAAGLSLSKSPQAGAGKVVTVANDNSSTAGGKAVTYNHTLQVEEDGAAALAAAKTAIVPVLSYDYRHMEQSKTAAEAYMTDSERQTYEKFFSVLQSNAPRIHAVVTYEPPLDAAVVRVSPGVVQVLIFMDQVVTNTAFKTPQTYQDWVTATMQKVGDQWLVGQLCASGTCD